MAAEAPDLAWTGPLQIGSAALLDALPDAAAVLDRDGTIIAVNRAWRLFALDNGGTPDSTGPGVNYLGVCTRAAAAGCADALAVADALHAVIAGHSVESDLEYPCPSPAVGRWFQLRATPIAWPELVGVLVSHVNISRRKLAEQDLQRRASEDPLTGLANRMLFEQRLASALAPRPGRDVVPDVGVLYLDLNDFKPVNDTFGHAAGDEVLQAVAARLRQHTRPQDTVARLGGDEFAVVAPRLRPDALAALVDRLTQALAEPHPIHGELVTLGASIGAYLAVAGEQVTAATARADQAMYAVKAARPRRDRAS